MAKGRIGTADGEDAVASWRQAADRASVARPTLATAVRYLLQGLAERYPGASVEVRVPPFGAIQCLEGPGHTRGTPPNVVETDPQTFLALALGETLWSDARAGGRISASGTRSDLGAIFPLR